MNCRRIQRKLLLGAMAGVFYFSAQGMTAEAAEGNVNSIGSNISSGSEYGTWVMETWATVDVGLLNIRVGPGTSYTIEETLEEGDTFIVLDEAENGWLTIQWGEDICYVAEKYVTQEVVYTYVEPEKLDEEAVEAVSIIVDGIDIAALSGELGGSSVVDFAMQFLGNDYVWGGTDLLEGSDCSGFVQSVYEYFGVELPRTSYTQCSAGEEISLEEIELGDIVCYSGHVGIYIGNDEIISALNSNKGVTISSITFDEIISIRRVI